MDAFTLLEVILALAILAGVLAALGEVIRLGDQSAKSARDETEAQILASSVMDELLSGARNATAVSKQQFDFETDPEWVFSVSIEPTEITELVRVGVRVEQSLEIEREPPYYELYRWMLNPDYVTALANEEAQLAAEAAASSSSGTGGTGGGG